MRWQLQDALGSGSMGQVFKAKGEDGKALAIKLLDASLTKEGDRFIERFKSEFSILKELSHPGINKVYDFGLDKDSGCYFFTTEYVDGKHFLEAVENADINPIESLFVEILRALEYLHSHGIMHGDIKSSNVLVCEDKGGALHAKIIDFGLAVPGSLNQVIGTPAYMAPEVISKDKSDGRADLYSLGVLIYAAITKFNPFKTASLSETFDRHLNLTPEPMSAYNPNTPVYLNNIILKLLKKSPDKRFPSAAHVIRAIGLYSGKSYPVETRETFLGYLPTSGNLIGRKEELSSIKDVCIGVRDARPNAPFALCVEGEIGTGKKRLLTELKFFAQLNEMTVFELESTDAVSIAAFSGELKQLFGKVQEPTVIICPVLGLLTIKQSASHLLSQLRDLVKWIKVSNVLSPVRGVPKILLTFGSTPDELPLILHLLDLDADDLTRIKLENFTEAETKEYLTTLTGVGDVPSQLATELFKRTLGNPLFITEVTKGLVESGMLFDKVGRWNREAIEDLGVHFERLKIPPTLTLTLSRIYLGALPEEKGVLEALAVWHRGVTLSELAGVSSVDNLRSVISGLIKSGVLEYSGGVYSLSNTLLRETIYEKMPQAARSRLHKTITEYLKKTRPDARTEIYWHTGKSEDESEAVDALLDLGKDYLKGLKFLEAVSTFSEAANRAQMSHHRLDEILLNLGEAYSWARNYPEAISTYNRLLAIYGAPSNEKKQITSYAVVCQKLAVAYLRNTELDKAQKILLKINDTLRTIDGETVLQLKVTNLLARVAFLEGRINDSLELYQGTKDKWRNLPPSEKRGVLNNDLAHVYLQTGSIELAEKEFAADIEYFETIGEKAELERSYYAVAELYRGKNELDKAAACFEKAIGIAKEIFDSELLLRAYNGLGNLYSAKKELEKSLYWYERGLDLAARTGEDSTAAAISVNIGLIKKESLNLDQATTLFEGAVKLLNQSEKKAALEFNYLLRAHLELADICRLKKEFIRANYHLNEAGKLSALPALKEQALMIQKVRTELERDQVSLLDISTKTELEERKDMKQYRYILEINKYLSGEDNLDFVLKTILKYAIELSGASSGLILLMDSRGTLEVKAACDIQMDDAVTEISIGIANKAIANNEIILTEDALADERFKTMESVMLLHLKSVICIPIHIRKMAVGTIYLENRSKAGAFAAVDKEVLAAFADQAGIAIENAKNRQKQREEEKRLKTELEASHLQLKKLDEVVKSHAFDLTNRYRFDKLASSSPGMKAIFDVLARISDTALSVCITGESGTGKELVARAIHYNSSQRGGPFIAVNCGAIPPTLIESELFGYKAGAFTGALKDKIGLFEAANGGTLFLDEIAEIDTTLQAKLLRVIQEREFTRVGDTKPIKCNVRILCATNKNLKKLLEEDKFRKDLYYRIAEIKIDLPPLRERVDDIPFLIEEFIADYSIQHQIEAKPKADGAFIRACIAYDWPGNIRELENAVRVATALASKGKISLNLLPENHALKTPHLSPLVTSLPDRHGEGGRFCQIDTHNRYDAKKTWKEYEGAIIAAAYMACGHNAKRTADSLKIATATVYKKVAELGLKDKTSPHYSMQFRYEVGTSLETYITRIFKAAWEYAGRHPYPAAKMLGVSHGYFYKIMKSFGSEKN